MATNDILTQNKETTPVTLGQRLLTGAKETVKKALGTALLSGIGGALAGSLGGFFLGDYFRDTIDNALETDDFSQPGLEKLDEFISQYPEKIEAVKEATGDIPKMVAAGGALLGVTSGTAAGAVGGAAYGAIKGTFWADKIKAEREMAEQAKANGQSNGIA